MKKLLLIILVLVLNGKPCLSQPYQPMLATSNQWHFTTCYSGCLTDVYYTNGDTLVNGENYKILDGYHYISRTFLLKESVSEKKVYLKKIFPTYTREFLLYDFSLDEGDVFEMKNPISPFPEIGGEFQLDSIRMKPVVNNMEYRHFYFSPTESNTIATYPVVWIEGIGSKSIINAPGGEADINGAGQLSCYFKDEMLVYAQLDSISSCDYLPLKVQSSFFSKIKIIKTDQKNGFKLQNIEHVKSIELFSINGQKLKTIINNQKNCVFLSLEEFQAGIYILLLQDEFEQRKIFKINSE